MDWTPVYVGASVLLNWLILYFWQPWAKAYSEEKGKNLARKEDLNQILAEVREVTVTQKTIESRLSGDLWNQQLITTQKKEIYADLLKVIHNTMTEYNGLKNLIHHKGLTPSQQMKDDIDIEVIKIRTEIAKLNQELLRLFGLAAIFTSRQCIDELSAFIGSLKLPDDDATEESAMAALDQIFKVNASLVKAARADFGIVLPKPVTT